MAAKKSGPASPAATKKSRATSEDVVRNGHTLREWATLFAGEAQRHSVDLEDLGSFFNNAKMVSEDRLNAFLDLDRAQGAYIDGNTPYALEIISKLVMVRRTYERIVPRAEQGVKQSETQRNRRKDKPGTATHDDERNKRIRNQFAAVNGERGAIKRLAIDFDMSPKQIGRIVRGMRT